MRLRLALKAMQQQAGELSTLCTYVAEACVFQGAKGAPILFEPRLCTDIWFVTQY